MRITEQGLLDKLYNAWRNKRIKGAAKKILDKDPEIKKAFQDINKANQRAIDLIRKQYPKINK